MTSAASATAQLNQAAPPWSVAGWVQGSSVELQDLVGKVVLLEVFQVNCPGCFLYALPRAIELHRQYADRGLVVLGIATAFEDFDKNTFANLQALLESGYVVGETLRVLEARGELDRGRWRYRIPFPVAMDNLLTVTDTHPGGSAVDDFIRKNLPDVVGLAESDQLAIRQRVSQYLQRLSYRPETFERYGLQGTPSQVLIDKRGMLRSSRFGSYPWLEVDIQRLLAE